MNKWGRQAINAQLLDLCGIRYKIKEKTWKGIRTDQYN